MNQFQGILPALITPFDVQERFNAQAFELLLERVYQANVHGVYVNGSTGEGLLQRLEQRKIVAEAAVQNSPRGKTVIVHVGAASTADSIELARHASRIGATAVSALPPFGNYTFAEIKNYYRAIAAAANVPLVAYYFPALNPIIKSAAEIIEICELPNVVGVKFTDHNLFALSVIKASGAVIYNGYDEVLTAGLLMGASGGIGTTYNLIPELPMQIYEAAQSGDWETARRIQTQLNEFITILVRYPIFPATKMILTWSGIDSGQCLQPRLSLSADETARLHQELERSSFAERLLT